MRARNAGERGGQSVSRDRHRVWIHPRRNGRDPTIAGAVPKFPRRGARSAFLLARTVSLLIIDAAQLAQGITGVGVEPRHRDAPSEEEDVVTPKQAESHWQRAWQPATGSGPWLLPGLTSRRPSSQQADPWYSASAPVSRLHTTLIRERSQLQLRKKKDTQ